MANIKTVSCDNCGVLKREVNHWWVMLANISKRSMFVCPLENILPSRTLNSSNPEPHGADLRVDTVSLRACGLECLSILESKIKQGVNPLKK